MKTNEIKKLVYKQKPKAKFIKIRMGVAYYISYAVPDEKKPILLNFEIPVTDMGDANFRNTMEAKLLLRWLK